MGFGVFFSFHSIWCSYDNLSIMYELENLDAAAAKKQTRMAEQSVAVNLSATRRLQRVSTTFEKVMIKIQRESSVRTNAVATVGLLRDAGHGVCKSNLWNHDSASIYKVVLLNLQALKSFKVMYTPTLLRFEDISLADQVLQAGGHTLKSIRCCYRASHSKAGVAGKSRNSACEGISLTTLITNPTEAQPTSVTRLLAWAKVHESRKCNTSHQP